VVRNLGRLVCHIYQYEDVDDVVVDGRAYVDVESDDGIFATSSF
jgi:hypothetical protein